MLFAGLIFILHVPWVVATSCCQDPTAECYACNLEVSLHDYCAEHSQIVGCEDGMSLAEKMGCCWETRMGGPCLSPSQLPGPAAHQDQPANAKMAESLCPTGFRSGGKIRFKEGVTCEDFEEAGWKTEGFVLVESGQCVAHVTSILECEEAATSLALGDTTAQTDNQVGKSHDPPYCYFEMGSLKFNGNGSNTGSCTAYDQCLCRVPDCWNSHSHKYLGGHACSHSQSTDLQHAKARCAWCDECGGVTCSGTNCTIRKGPSLLHSRFNEISYTRCQGSSAVFTLVDDQGIMTMADAESYCNIHGGRLASIHSTGEAEEIYNLVGGRSSVGVRVGGRATSTRYSSNCATAECWAWDDGSPMNFLGWDVSEPDNIAEDCIMLRAHDLRTWNDVGCSIAFEKFICRAVLTRIPTGVPSGTPFEVPTETPTELPTHVCADGPIIDDCTCDGNLRSSGQCELGGTVYVPDLVAIARGCFRLKTESDCVAHYDGRRGYFYNQPCAWCCGGGCLRKNSAKCEPENFVKARARGVNYKTGSGVDTCPTRGRR